MYWIVTELAPFIDVMRQKYVMSQSDTIELMRSFRSIPSMYPKGGDAIWGNQHSSADDIQMYDQSIGAVDSFKLVRHYGMNGQCSATLNSSFNSIRGSFLTVHINGTRHDLTIEGATELLRREAPEYMKSIDTLYSFSSKLLDNTSTDAAQQRYWSNPLTHTLPYAPNMTTYCLHGVGRHTERSYSYSYDPYRSIPYYINTSHTNESVRIRNGVGYNDGDGTVNLISLGYLCQLWRDDQYNPSNSTVITREYKDKLSANNTSALYNAIIDGVSTVIRPSDSVDHVDIMGNYDLILDLLRIVGKKSKPSKHDKFCSDNDIPYNTTDIIDRNTSVVYDDESKMNELIELVTNNPHNIDNIDEIISNTTAEHIDSLNMTQSLNNATHLSTAVQPGACLQRHISVRELREERVNRHIERLRRFMGCDSNSNNIAAHHSNACNDIHSSINEQIQIGSDTESTRDTEHGIPLSEADYTHYHYVLYDRYFSCIKQISAELNKRLDAIN